MTEIDFTTTSIATTKDEIDVEHHFLGTTVSLSDGTEGLVFSRGSKNESNYFLYNCHLCGVANLPGERCLQTHIAGKKHQSRLSQSVIDAHTFHAATAPLNQKHKIQMMNIAPGEPVPPGFENEVKPMPEIQGVLNKYKENALIGIEYCLELTSRDIKEPNYICLICDKRGDQKTMISHWTSYNHRLKYLEKHFPSVIKELVPYRYNPEARNVMPRLIQTIAEAIEDHHGRLTPTVVDSNEFKKNRNKIMQEISFEKHFDEKIGPNFVNVIDKKMIDNLIRGSKSISINIDTKKNCDSASTTTDKRAAAKRIRSDTRKDRNSLDSISSDSDASITQSSSSQYLMDRNNKKRKSQSPAYCVVSRVKRSPPFEEEHKTERKITLPTPKELSKQASEITHEKYKWEKYRCLVEIAVKELEKALKEHEKSPEKHPLYPEEWKKFWNRRYKELQAEKKDPSKYDFKPEWIIFWTKRMRDLHDEEIERKKKEIKRKLGFEDNDEEKVDQLRKQYKVKAPVKHEKPPLAVIDISDDESVSSRRSKIVKRYSRSRSRCRSHSLSSLSDDYSSRRSRDSRIRERTRDRDRERDRDQDNYYSKERETLPPVRERYVSSVPPVEYYARHPRPNYYPPVVVHGSHYSYRTMKSYEIPQYEPSANVEEPEPDDDGPLTVVAVLRLLTALEDHLGSLGPRIVDLLAKALALEKVKANSSDEMLLNEDNSVFFETVKEKLKGQLIANVLDSHKIKAVKKAIKNIAAVIHQVNANRPLMTKNDKDQKTGEDKKSVDKMKSLQKEFPFDRQVVVSKLAAALVVQEKTDVSTEDMDKLIHIFILMVKMFKEKGKFEVKDILIDLGVIPQGQRDIEEVEEKQEKTTTLNPKQTMAALLQTAGTEKEFSIDIFDPNDEEDDGQPQNSSGALESLTDSDLQTLLQNFKHLSSEEQHHLIAHLKKLESTDPERVEKLRKFVDLSDLKKEKEKFPEESATQDIKGKKNLVSMYSDDDEEDIKIQKMIDSEDDDDDDDDYNFDEVVKAASNNIQKDSKHIIDDRPSKEPDTEPNSSSTVTTLNAPFSDTQNLIANLIGSLQKNSQVYNQQTNTKVSETNTSTTGGNIIPTLVSQSMVNNRESNLPFYQQLSAPKQQSSLSNQQIQNINQIFPAAVNPNFQNSNSNSNNVGGGGVAVNHGNLNFNHMFNQTQPHQQQLQKQIQATSINVGTENNSGGKLPFDLGQLQPFQVQQMLTSLLAQQQQQQHHQHTQQQQQPQQKQQGGGHQQWNPIDGGNQKRFF